MNEEDQQSFQELKEVKNNFAFSSNFTKEDYLSSVEKIKSYIKAGDVMQVVLAQDFFAEFKHDPWSCIEQFVNLIHHRICII